MVAGVAVWRRKGEGIKQQQVSAVTHEKEEKKRNDYPGGCGLRNTRAKPRKSPTNQINPSDNKSGGAFSNDSQ